MPLTPQLPYSRCWSGAGVSARGGRDYGGAACAAAGSAGAVALNARARAAALGLLVT